MSQPPWEKVFSTPDLYRAEIVRAVLEEYEIPAAILNKKDTAYNNFGQVEVCVDRRNVIAALKIIADEISFE